MRVRFALLAEGSSDRGLIPHLEALCVELGAEEAAGCSPPFDRLGPRPSKSVAARLAALPKICPEINLVFVHRDADNVGHEDREKEIATGTPADAPPVVAVIPVTELEAWLLLDERALFAAVGQPFKAGVLKMPRPNQVEGVADPKTLLKELLAEASGKRGRRLAQVNKRFPSNRHFLLERLNLDGPVQDLPAWQRLLAALQEALDGMAARERGEAEVSERG